MQVCDVTLTKDFWEVTLPNDLATSSPRSPSLFAYNAALVLLDARVLFSDARMSDLFDPAMKANRSSIERHHLFPKAHLAAEHKISTIRDTNQIANYAYVEWADNAAIADKSPNDYVPILLERFSQAELERMYHHHALPPQWETMPYREFLEKRRELMATVTWEGYKILAEGPAVSSPEAFIDLAALVDNGESHSVEFKSTLRTNLHTRERDKRMEQTVLKSLAAFLNTNGGTLVIGVADDGTPVGIEEDGFPDEDKMALHLVNLVSARMGPNVMTSLHVQFDDYEGARVMVIRCPRFPNPVFTKDGEVERFYVRTGPSTTELSLSQTQTYIQQHFKL